MSFISRLRYYSYSRRTWELCWGFFAFFCLHTALAALEEWDWTLLMLTWYELITTCVFLGFLAVFLTWTENRGDLFDKGEDGDLA